MEEKKLYPLRFLPLEDIYSWGRDSFKVADLGYRDTVVADGWLAANMLSEVMETYMDRVVGDHVFASYGRLFPVQIKRISVEGKMPLRVHPDDEISEQRYDSLGREKLWYIAKASPDARLCLGWKRAIDASELIEGIKSGALEAVVNMVTPKAGDFFRIKPGLVHGAAGTLEIVEVSESSALDFCVYAWGGQVSDEEFDPAMSIVDALDFIDYGPYAPAEMPTGGREGMKLLADLPQFTVRKMDLRDPLHITGGEHNSYAIYLCLYGKAAVQLQAPLKVDYPLEAGQVLLVPAEVDDFILAPLAQTTSVLEIMTEYKPESDAYINPDVEAKVPGEEDDE
ncbi:MAG: hypothetical protein IKS71_04700 [Bacteroidales bacterium]|nr:hypothetical protein [Bacteroidales bacterium]